MTGGIGRNIGGAWRKPTVAASAAEEAGISRGSANTMNKRPHSVTVIGCLFLVACLIGVGYHAREFKMRGPFRYDVLWVCLVRVLAIVGAVFVLRGHNWARWLLAVWMAFHVVLSGFHSVSELIVHAGLFASPVRRGLSNSLIAQRAAHGTLN